MLVCSINACKLHAQLVKYMHHLWTAHMTKKLIAKATCLLLRQQPATKRVQGLAWTAIQYEVYLVILAAIARFFSLALCSSWQVLR